MMFPITSVSSLLLPVAMGVSSSGTGAAIELAAGQSPTGGSSDSDATVRGELRLAAGYRRQQRRHTTELRYLPRLSYRSGAARDRPLLLHRLVGANQTALSQVLRLTLGAEAVLGELDQTTALSETLGSTNALLNTPSISIFSGSVSSSLVYELSRISRVSFGVETGYRTPTDVGVLPGLDTVDSEQAGVARSVDVASVSTYERSLSRRLLGAAPLSLSYFWSERIGAVGVVGFEPRIEYALSRQTDIQAAAGVTYARLPSDALSDTPAIVTGLVAIARTFSESDVERSVVGASIRHGGEFDKVQGDYRPVLSLDAQVELRRGDWSVAGAVDLSIVTADEIGEGARRSGFGLELPVGYRINDSLGAAFGVRASAFSVEWPRGPLRPTRVEALGFASIRGVWATSKDAGWVL